jgi:hypothetical protein
MLIEPHNAIQNRRRCIMSNTTATLAAALDTTPRTLRKFLRSADMGVGKGSRYALPSSKREVASLAKRFAEWEAARTPAPEAVDEVN